MFNFHCVCHVDPRKIENSGTFNDALTSADDIQIVESPSKSFCARAERGVLTAQLGDYYAVGRVRLDNIDDLMKLASVQFDNQLVLILLLYAKLGSKVCNILVGDFSIVIWNEADRSLLAIRDAIGVRRLFYRTAGHSIFLGTKSAEVAGDSAIDSFYVASFLGITESFDTSRTIWKNAHALPPGNALVWNGNSVFLSRYWELDESPHSYASEEEVIEEFRALFLLSVKSRCNGVNNIWAELSGGLDSSSIVGASQVLYNDGHVSSRLTRTYSFTDGLAGANESSYSDEVAKFHSIDNERINGYGPWQEDDLPKPITDEPRVYYPFWARDRRAARLVAADSATVVLSGIGSDQYLGGTPIYLADLLRRGSIGTALKEAHAMGARHRKSTWQILYKWGVTPLVRGRVTNAVKVDQDNAWLIPSYQKQVSRLALDQTDTSTPHYKSYSQSKVWNFLAAAPRSLEVDLEAAPVEKRYPFLDRRVIEFCFRLPPTFMLRQGETKWLLRQAARQMIPTAIYERRTKGLIDSRIFAGLTEKKTEVDILLKNPILAQYGWINAVGLRGVVDRARRGDLAGSNKLMRVLALETWLSSRQ